MLFDCDLVNAGLMVAILLMFWPRQTGTARMGAEKEADYKIGTAKTTRKQWGKERPIGGK